MLIEQTSQNVKVRNVARLIYERTSRVMGLNVVYLLIFNSDNTKHVCERERGKREREGQRVHVCNSERGFPLIQVKGSRVLLLCIVYVHKPCMQFLKHTYEYKCVYLEYNTLITIMFPKKLLLSNFDSTFLVQILWGV
jgi:hypothetical protein